MLININTNYLTALSFHPINNIVEIVFSFHLNKTLKLKSYFLCYIFFLLCCLMWIVNDWDISGKNVQFLSPNFFSANPATPLSTDHREYKEEKNQRRRPSRVELFTEILRQKVRRKFDFTIGSLPFKWETG